ncbi:MAG: DUF885 family protein, partial [Chitinophagaceae bacterium]
MNHYQLNPGLLALGISIFLFTGLRAQKAVDLPALESVTTHYWADYLRLNPLAATSAGVPDYNDQLEIRIGRTWLSDARVLANRYLDSLKRFDRVLLSERDRLVYDLLGFTLQRDLDGYDLNIVPPSSLQRPVDQFVFSFITSFATLGSGAGAVPFKTVKDYDGWNKRLHIFPQWIDTAIGNMNEGIRAGNTNPRAAMVKVPPQLKPLFELTADSAVFFKPIRNFPANFTEAEKARITSEYRSTINEVVRPAYKKMHDYLVNTYIPAARTSSGLLDNDGGKKEYLYWINFWT